jgi:hypothetical protein
MQFFSQFLEPKSHPQIIIITPNTNIFLIPYFIIIICLYDIFLSIFHYIRMQLSLIIIKLNLAVCDYHQILYHIPHTI